MSESQQSQQGPKRTGRRTADNPVDWELIEKEYRVGQSTLRQLAATHHVDPAAISRMAKRKGWVQDKRAEVKARSEAQLLQASGKPLLTTVTGKSTPLDQVIDDAASARTQIILAHRRDALRGRTLALRMMDELDVMTTAPALLRDLQDCLTKCMAGGEVPEWLTASAERALQGALTVNNRAAVLKSLSESITKFVAIEREAFGINDPAPPSPGDPAAGAFSDFQAFKSKFLAAVERHRNQGVIVQ